MTKRYNCVFIFLALFASSSVGGATIDLAGTYRNDATRGFHEHKRLPLAAIDFTLDFVAFDADTRGEMLVEARHLASSTVVRVGAAAACTMARTRCDAVLDAFMDKRGRLSARFSVDVTIDDRSGPWEVTLTGFDGILLKGEIDLRGGDSDADGVSDAADNCTDIANPGQQDTDDDGIGNACDADIAMPNDCIVNVADLGIIKQAFFSNPGSANWNPNADFNSDDVVNVLDLGETKRAFFGAPGPSGVPNICEPGVYVSPLGDNADPGTRVAPLRTISAAMALARLDAVDIYAASGSYDENTIGVAAGTSIIGGLDAGWVPSAAVSEITVIEPIALLVENVATPTLIRGLRLVGSGNDMPGASAYGARIINSTGIVIRDSEILAGGTFGAADGIDAPAATPIAGTNGTDGQPGCEDGGFGCLPTCDRPNGGVGGNSGGGDGGRPGHGTSSGNGGGQGVGDGPSAPGGFGGSGDNNGGTGATGSTGVSGQGGQTGAPFYLAAGYSPAAGQTGLGGGTGVGGGGGGGGGGGNFGCNSYGGGGGGGGGGGDGGEPGQGAASAGGSFALYVWDSTVVVEATHLVTGSAGNGGRGGAGGPGAMGGARGDGGDGEQDSGRGGNGGNGGQGGVGGGGGGGAGGPSVGLLSNSNAQLTLIDATYDIGTPGLGGLTPGGTSGPDGLGAETFVVP